MSLLTVKNVMAMLNISMSKMYHLIESGKMPHYRIDGAIRISDEQVNKFLEERKREREDSPARQKPPRPQRQFKHLDW